MLWYSLSVYAILVRNSIGVNQLVNGVFRKQPQVIHGKQCVRVTTATALSDAISLYHLCIDASAL